MVIELKTNFLSVILVCFQMATHNSGKLQVMTWNANSSSPKQHEFFDFLLSGSIDIALLNGTYLKQGVPFSHPDYSCYRLDRADRLKGGIAILVRQELPHTLVSSFKTKILECIGISVASVCGPIEFISAYRPGGWCTPEDISKFRDDFLQLTSSRSSFLNARHSSWKCSRANQAGKALFECDGPFAVQYPPTHTRILLSWSQNPSTLDIILKNGFHDVENICTRTALSSDHLSVILRLSLMPVQQSLERHLGPFSSMFRLATESGLFTAGFDDPKLY
jgi:hypothetical protein